MLKRSELNAPAGNSEKLKVAIKYGADAVYCGLKEFNLRNYADNFSTDQLSETTGYVHDAGKKIYVALNIFARNSHLDSLPEIVKELSRIKVDALIISDPGFIRLIQKHAPDIPIFLSTQMNVTNLESVKFWQDIGIKRIILARELSLKEICEIRDATSIELEVFIHGSMCVAFSGRCILSTYMASRGANLGECTQPCRWKYHLLEEKRPGEYYPVFDDGEVTQIMSSKDLCMVEHIPELVGIGVESFKIEGRMRGIPYLASVTAIYRALIDKYLNDPADYKFDDRYIKELEKTSNRGFCTGFFFGSPGVEDYNFKGPSYHQDYKFIGLVDSLNGNMDGIKVNMKGKILKGDNIEILTPDGKVHEYCVEKIVNEENEIVEVAQPNSTVKIFPYEDYPELSVLRKIA